MGLRSTTAACACWLLYAGIAIAQTELLQAPDDAPQYQLSNLRVADGGLGGLQKVVLVDFKRTRAGGGQVVLVGRTVNGQFQLQEFGRSKFDADSGTVLLDGGIGLRSLHNESFELWLQQRAFLSGPNQAYMVSNSVVKGNLNSTTAARAWTDQERATYAENKKSNTPPAQLPADHVEVESIDKLVPGMPVLAGWKGDWAPAEIISVQLMTGLVTLKYEKHPDPLVQRPLAKWIAAKPAILAEVASDPTKFEPTVRTLPGGSLAIPAKTSEVIDDTPLVVGTPLLFEQFTRWESVCVVELKDDGKVKIGWKDRPPVWDRDVSRSSLLISETTLAKLAKPEAAKELTAAFAAAREKHSAGPGGNHFPTAGAPTRPDFGRRLQNYPIRIGLLKNTQIVSAELPLEVGTPLAACWGSRWYSVKVLAVNDDGTVRIHWDDYGDPWDGDIKREQLIIENKTVRKLTSKAKTTTRPAGEGTSTDLHTWTDASGTFKIDAVFVKKTEAGVTLRRQDGRELTLPLDKLCQDDQNLVAEVTGKVKNPFAP